MERALGELRPNVRARCAHVAGIDVARKHVLLEGGERVAYDRLCVATGAVPKPGPVEHPAVFTIRDTWSVEHLCARIAHARSVVVVGNGGIALGTQDFFKHCSLSITCLRWLARRLDENRGMHAALRGCQLTQPPPHLSSQSSYPPSCSAGGAAG